MHKSVPINVARPTNNPMTKKPPTRSNLKKEPIVSSPPSTACVAQRYTFAIHIIATTKNAIMISAINTKKPMPGAASVAGGAAGS